MTPSQFQAAYKCVDDGIELMRLALGVVMYFSGDLAAHRRGLTAAVDAAWPLVEHGVRSFQTTNMKTPRKLKDRKDVLLKMLDEPPSPVYDYVAVDNRRKIDDAPDCCIELSYGGYRSSGYIMCRLPVGTTGADDALLDLTLKIASQWDFAHGYAGYTLALNTMGLKAVLPKWMFYGIGMRHPGVDLPSAANTSFAVADGIKRVNWLTLLGTGMAARTGNLAGLARQPGITVHETAASVVVQAGDEPLIGDTNRRDICEVYHRVGRALKGIRARNPPAFIIAPNESIASDEMTETWLSSLDE